MLGIPAAEQNQDHDCDQDLNHSLKPWCTTYQNESLSTTYSKGAVVFLLLLAVSQIKSDQSFIFH